MLIKLNPGETLLALVPHQEFLKQFADSGLLISRRVAQHNQNLPVVRYGIPHVRIVSPEGWQGTGKPVGRIHRGVSPTTLRQ